MTAAQQRKVQRIIHLTTGLMVGIYVYASPSGAVEMVIRFVALPVLVITGILMWQAPRIRRLRKARSGA